MKEEVLPTLPDRIWDDYEIPPDILAAIQANERAWQHFRNFSPAYIRIRIAYIDQARKRPQDFEKRLANFVKRTEENKQIGYGGIDRYY